MPAKDGSGPAGMGPGTGRGMGSCKTDRVQNATYSASGRDGGANGGMLGRFWRMGPGRLFRRRAGRVRSR